MSVALIPAPGPFDDDGEVAVERGANLAAFLSGVAHDSFDWPPDSARRPDSKCSRPSSRAYAAYAESLNGAVAQASCRAHARRESEKAKDSEPRRWS